MCIATICIIVQFVSHFRKTVKFHTKDKVGLELTFNPKNQEIKPSTKLFLYFSDYLMLNVYVTFDGSKLDTVL